MSPHIHEDSAGGNVLRQAEPGFALPQSRYQDGAVKAILGIKMQVHVGLDFDPNGNCRPQHPDQAERQPSATVVPPHMIEDETGPVSNCLAGCHAQNGDCHHENGRKGGPTQSLFHSPEYSAAIPCVVAPT